MEIHLFFMDAKLLLNSLIKTQWTDSSHKELHVNIYGEKQIQMSLNWIQLLSIQFSI